MTSGDADVKQQVAAHWDRRAAHFDEDFGHSIRTPAERAAWDRILDLEPLVEWGAIAPKDAELLIRVNTVDEAFIKLRSSLETVLEAETEKEKCLTW